MTSWRNTANMKACTAWAECLLKTGACLYIPMARPASLEKLPRNKEQTSSELMKDATRQKIEGTTGGHKNAQEKLHPKS